MNQSLLERIEGEINSEWMLPMFDPDISVKMKKEALATFAIIVAKNEIRDFMQEIQKRAEIIPPNLLLNEVVNYAHDRLTHLKAEKDV